MIVSMAHFQFRTSGRWAKMASLTFLATRTSFTVYLVQWRVSATFAFWRRAIFRYWTHGRNSLPTSFTTSTAPLLSNAWTSNSTTGPGTRRWGNFTLMSPTTKSCPFWNTFYNFLFRRFEGWLEWVWCLLSIMDCSKKTGRIRPSYCWWCCRCCCV